MGTMPNQDRGGPGRDRLSSADAILWTMDRDPVLRSTITAVIVLDQEPPFEEVIRRLESLCRHSAHFRSVVAPACAPWDRARWKEIDDFDVVPHVKHVRVAWPADGRALLDLAQGLAGTPLDPARPLWDATLVDGIAGDRSALVIRVHHAVIDGVGGLQVVASVLDSDRSGRPLSLRPGAEPPRRAGPPAAGPRASTRVTGAAGAAAATFARIPRWAFSTAVKAASHPAAATRQWMGTAVDAGRLVAPSPRPLSPLWVERSLARRFELLELSPGILRGGAGHPGTTINDQFVAGLLRGLSLYHLRHGIRVRHLRCIMPVSSRRTTDPVESNRFVPVRIVLPADLPDTRAYLQVVPDILSKWKRAPALRINTPVSDVLDGLPAPLTVGALAMMLKGADFVATDIPGPPVETFFAGARLEAFYAFAPTTGAAVNAALVTLAGRPAVGLNIDTGAVPDPATLVECLGQGFEELTGASASSGG